MGSNDLDDDRRSADRPEPDPEPPFTVAQLVLALLFSAILTLTLMALLSWCGVPS